MVGYGASQTSTQLLASISLYVGSPSLNRDNSTHGLYINPFVFEKALQYYNELHQINQGNY